jgi:hypothetical protein
MKFTTGGSSSAATECNVELETYLTVDPDEGIIAGALGLVISLTFYCGHNSRFSLLFFWMWTVACNLQGFSR